MTRIGVATCCAVATVVLCGCANDGGFELRVRVTASAPDAVQGTSGERDLSFQFATAAAAVAMPPSLVVTDGAGPHSFVIVFDCAFANAHEDPIQVEVEAGLWREGTTLKLVPFTHSCLYANGIQVLVTP